MKRMRQGSGSRLAGFFILLAVALIAAWGAGSLMFSSYMFYDDEGYVLYSYKSYIEHGRLYRDVYSQYGPAPYALYDSLHRFLGFPITHEAGRYLTLGIWIGVAAAGAALVRKLTRSLCAAAFALASTVAFLWPMMSEPAHPGGLTVVLTACGALGGAVLWISEKRRTFVLLNGAIGALLALTKINVGAFYILSCCLFLALQGEVWVGKRTGLRLGMAIVVGLPFALMWRHMGTPWALTLACLFAAGGIATLFVAGNIAESRNHNQTDERRTALLPIFIGAGILTTLIVCVSVIARGSGITDLWEGIIAGPLRHPNAFSVKYTWNAITLPVAIASMLLLAWAASRLVRGGGQAEREKVDRWIAGARVFSLVLFVTAFSRFPDYSPDRTLFSFLHATLWLALWPLKREGEERTWSAKMWIGIVLLFQSLHVYPVPGSQISWGTYLMIPLFVISWVDAAAWWAEKEPRARKIGMVLAGVLTLSVCVSLAGLKSLDSNIKDSEPMGLEGTGPLRLPLTNVATYHLLSNNAVIHGDMLFSGPGMFSFNLWTGLPTPTFANVTHWFSLLSREQQQAIIDKLSAQRRAVVILHREHADFLARLGFKPRGLLWDYINNEMPLAFKTGDWEFRTHRGRKIVPFLTGDFLYLPKKAISESAKPQKDGRLELILPALPAGEIQAVEVCCLRRADGTALHLDASNAHPTSQGITLEGKPVTAEGAAHFPYRAERPAKLNIHFSTEGYMLDRQRPIVRLLDARGQTITYVVLQQ